MSDAEFWGKHALVDAGGCNVDDIRSRDNIVAFTKALVNAIDMKAYGEPIVEHFATHDPSKGGWSLCQLIETSLIDGHFVDATGQAFISVHSCKDFDIDVVIDTIKHYFAPERIKHTVVLRSI